MPISNLPFSGLNLPPGALLSPQERAQVEGIEANPGIVATYPTNYAFDGTMTVAANGASAGSLAAQVSVYALSPQYTKRWWVDSLTIWSSDAVKIGISLGEATAQNRAILNPGTTVLPIHDWASGKAGLGVTLMGRVEGTGNVLLNISGRLMECANDVDYGAPHTLLALGDSNTASTNIEGQTGRGDNYLYKVKKWLAQQGKRTRILDKSQTGYTTGNFETYRQKGRLDLPYQPSVILYNLGTNDTDLTTYTSNVQMLVDWKRWRYPDSILILCGVFPAQSSARETNNVSFRTAAASIASTAADPKVLYCNLGTIFTAASGLAPDGVTSCYTTTDGSTSTTRLHLNVAGHVQATAGITAFMSGNGVVAAMSPSN